MPNTYYRIVSRPIYEATSSITFSNIPQTYTDLKIVGSTRQDGTANGIQLSLTFNSSASGYSRTLIYGAGSGSPVSASGNSEAFTRFGWAQDGAYTANVFGSFEIYIPSYSGSTYTKSFLGNSVTENNATEAFMGPHSNLWTDTAAAITSVTITISSGTTLFAANSSFSLYGINNS